jgi:hypothetical protein
VQRRGRLRRRHRGRDADGAGQQRRGHSGLPVTIATEQGGDGGPGALTLDCQQSFIQLDPGQSDCAAAVYPAAQRVVYTTGTAEAYFFAGAPKVGSGQLTLTGEPFQCSAWSVTDGPGQLVGTFLVEDEPRAGDVAQATVIDD